MITVTGLTKRYGRRVAVDDLTFDVAAGRVTGFVGPNGAGKSTTMRMMVGLTRPDQGDVRYDGVTLHPICATRPESSAPCSMPGACTRAARARNHLLAAAALSGIPARRVGEVLERGRARQRGRPARRRLLARHAPAPRPRRRPARRTRGAVARRALQRPRPRRHPLAAQLAPRTSPIRAARSSCPAT